jgi:hypothetical protein
MTPYNVYLAENTTRIREGDPALISPGSGMAIPAGLSAGSVSAGIVSIWSREPGPAIMSVFAQKIDNGIGSAEVTSLQNLSFEQIAVVSGFDQGREYFIYCIITDLPINSMTRCSASAAFKVLVQ